MKKIIAANLALFLLVIVCFVVILKSVNSCTTEVKERGLKNIVNEVWEGNTKS